MKVRSLRASSLLALLAALGPQVTTADAALTPRIERVSVDDAGQRYPQIHNTRGRVSISADGRYVAFYSFASLTPGAAGLNVYVRDRLRGMTELISDGVPPASTEPNNMLIGMSADGQRVVFASNLTFNPTDDRGTHDIYVRDRTTGRTTLITPRTSTGQRAFPPSSSWVLSSNGAFVTFTTPRFWWDSVSRGNMSVYVHDIATDVTSSVFADVGMNWRGPSITDDGRYVAATGEVVHVRDRTTGVDVYTGVPESGGGVVSPDGTHYAYSWRAAYNAPTQVRLADLTSGITTQLTNAQGSQFAAGNAYQGSWSADSRQFAFLANYPVAPEGSPGVIQVYVYDRQTASFWAAPVLDRDTPDGETHSVAIAASRTVAFGSVAQNLVPDDGSGVSLYLPDDFGYGEPQPREDIYVQDPVAPGSGSGVVPTPPCPPVARECGPPDQTPRR